MNLLDRALTQRTDVKLKKQKPVFTKAEINHLLGLIYVNEQEGTYNGVYEHYAKRTESIKQKLNNQLKEMI